VEPDVPLLPSDRGSIDQAPSTFLKKTIPVTNTTTIGIKHNAAYLPTYSNPNKESETGKQGCSPQLQECYCMKKFM